MTYCFKYFITATNGPPTGGPPTGGPHTGGPHTGGPHTGGPHTGGPPTGVPPCGGKSLTIFHFNLIVVKISILFVCLMVFSATFSNISVML